MQNDSTAAKDTSKWYAGVTSYMWLVLMIGSLGWVFDIFEGQIFVASMKEAMPSLLPADKQDSVSIYNNAALGTFLLGGALYVGFILLTAYFVIGVGLRG